LLTRELRTSLGRCSCGTSQGSRQQHDD
jgi:hypothetical protein